MSAEMDWITGSDTGVSSMTIWAVMMRAKAPNSSVFGNWPHDPSDFGRCYRLLELVPAWRPRLPLMSVVFPAWEPMVKAWPELEALWLEERHNSSRQAPKLYARMQQVGAECRAIRERPDPAQPGEGK